MALSEKEIFFQRLYTRTKSLCLLEDECNIYRLKSNVKTLEQLYIFLQDDKNLSEELSLSYGNWLYEIKIILEALLEKSTEEKIKVLDKLPRTYPSMTYDSSKDTEDNDSLSTNVVNATLRNRYYKDCRDDLLYNKKNNNETDSSVHQTVYYADLRKELFGDETVLGHDNTELSNDAYMLQQNEKQEKLANELLNLTKAMKSNFQATRKVLKDDNALLDTMSQKFDKSKDKLNIESKNLSLHARGSLCDCLTFLMIFVVVWSFIGMAMMMRFFPKNVV